MARKSIVPPTDDQVLAIKKVVEHMGSQIKLAKAIGVTPSSVSNWCQGLTGVSARNAEKIETLLGVEFIRSIDLSSCLMKEYAESQQDQLSDYR